MAERTSGKPEGQKLLDELALVYVEAAVRRLIKEEGLLIRVSKIATMIGECD
jgi:hypothetical protein